MELAAAAVRNLARCFIASSPLFPVLDSQAKLKELFPPLLAQMLDAGMPRRFSDSETESSRYLTASRAPWWAFRRAHDSRLLSASPRRASSGPPPAPNLHAIPEG